MACRAARTHRAHRGVRETRLSAPPSSDPSSRKPPGVLRGWCLDWTAAAAQPARETENQPEQERVLRPWRIRAFASAAAPAPVPKKHTPGPRAAACVTGQPPLPSPARAAWPRRGGGRARLALVLPPRRQMGLWVGARGSPVQGFPRAEGLGREQPRKRALAAGRRNWPLDHPPAAGPGAGARGGARVRRLPPAARLRSRNLGFNAAALESSLTSPGPTVSAGFAPPPLPTSGPQLPRWSSSPPWRPPGTPFSASGRLL